MLNRLYKKSRLSLALTLIAVYVVATSMADAISQQIGAPKLLSFIFLLTFSFWLFVFLKKNALLKEYGLCRPAASAKRFLYYIPLIFICTSNFWLGICQNMPLLECVFYIGSMLCVGFVEELIFRGFLFKAMEKDSIKPAVIVSSITFGIGHIVNLINGSGAELCENICQIVSAVAFGFLFVVIFYRGKSLIPCIICHSAINSFSAFAAPLTAVQNIITSAILTIVVVSYTFVLTKTLPKN